MTFVLNISGLVKQKVFLKTKPKALKSMAEILQQELFFKINVLKALISTLVESTSPNVFLPRLTVCPTPNVLLHISMPSFV